MKKQEVLRQKLNLLGEMTKEEASVVVVEVLKFLMDWKKMNDKNRSSVNYEYFIASSNPDYFL